MEYVYICMYKSVYDGEVICYLGVEKIWMFNEEGNYRRLWYIINLYVILKCLRRWEGRNYYCSIYLGLIFNWVFGKWNLFYFYDFLFRVRFI